MKKIISFLFCISISLFAQNLKVKIEPIWTIGNEKQFKKEYIFKSPQQVVTDKDCNLYVRENMGTDIKKYDKNGKYIKTIGRSGQGPGEFRHVENIFINDKNELVVKDQMNYRYSYFSLDGKLLRIEKMTPESQTLFNSSLYENGNVIGQVQVNNYKLEHGNKFVVYDGKFQNQITSFGHTSLFWNYSTVMDVHEDSWCHMRYAIAGTKFAISKEYYTDKIYLFDREKKWECTAIKGKHFGFLPYEIVEEMISRENARLHTGSAMGFGMEWNGKHRVFAVYIRVRSMGLFVADNKYFVNFLASAPSKGVVEFGADIFALNGDYKGYNKLDAQLTYLNGNVECKDAEGNYVMTDYDDKTPVIKKFRLVIN